MNRKTVLIEVDDLLFAPFLDRYSEVSQAARLRKATLTYPAPPKITSTTPYTTLAESP